MQGGDPVKGSVTGMASRLIGRSFPGRPVLDHYKKYRSDELVPCRV